VQTKHWIGAVIVLAIGYYLGTKGTFSSVISKVTG
jgi:hypothetical protein